MPIYQQIPIRLQADIVSNPPAPLVDANTDQAPRFWRGQDIAIAVGIFDNTGDAVDLSNLTYLQIVIQQTPASLFPLVSSVVNAGDIIPSISRAAWLDGQAQQATFRLTTAQTDQGLGGMDEAPFWLTLQGQTTDGARLVYAAGYVTIYNPGAISALPPPQGLVSAHKQDSAGGSVTVTPLSQLHTEEITVSGAPGTRPVVIGATNIIAGAHVWLRFVLPATAGIVIQIYDQAIVGGNLLFSFECDGSGYTPSALYTVWFDGVNWKRLSSIVPATGQQS